MSGRTSAITFRIAQSIMEFWQLRAIAEYQLPEYMKASQLDVQA